MTDINEAKKSVIEAGHLLVETGLIARTWGNISCRISDTEFVITPSGKAYDSLTPDDIVTVNINDLSYSGDVKPSSEKGIHADCYRLRKDTGFVIHTHQTNASVLSVLPVNLTVKTPREVALLGAVIPIASYGLPGTKKLRKGVSSALTANPDSKAVIMAHHGAVCLGRDFGEAFKIALSLEKLCEEKLIGRINTITSAYDGEAFVSEKKDGKIFVDGTDETEPSRELDIHKAIYSSHPNVTNIVHDTDPYAVKCSNEKKKLKPMLDDFAQLVGISLKTASDNDDDIKKKSKGRNAVLVKGRGAYCFASTADDAKAVEIILNKGCKTEIEAPMLGKTKKIGIIDSVLMRVVYLKKYSKQIEK
ncbi:MAG: class II aldolase/adducin family protein [Clostridiales bacterium]|nr:class II aldolase/adducin family protein [Clostridiales bacterium]